VKVEIKGNTFEVRLNPFRSEGNEKYSLVDTGCLLELLKRFKTFCHMIEKNDLKLAILEMTICEIAEHLRKSKGSLLEKNLTAFHIDSAAQNLRKLLQDKRLKKVANPRIASEKKLLKYKQFGEDALLAYTLYEGKFKAIATKDGPLIKRLEKARFAPCQSFFKK
jgi:predicted nucleic acid-binding protein